MPTTLEEISGQYDHDYNALRLNLALIEAELNRLAAFHPSAPADNLVTFSGDNLVTFSGDNLVTF